MLTCTKIFGEYAAAHRITGHPQCGNLHGHNYTIEITFVSLISLKVMDDNGLSDHGFVIDFGKLDKIDRRLRKLFDHTILVSREDTALIEALKTPFWTQMKTTLVENTSCECLAETVYQEVQKIVLKHGVAVHLVKVFESSRTFACFRPE
jgi:6-pyruvoyltetrahydropterin/6-carboxytetrahydropterin synthase